MAKPGLPSRRPAMKARHDAHFVLGGKRGTWAARPSGTAPCATRRGGSFSASRLTSCSFRKRCWTCRRGCATRAASSSGRPTKARGGVRGYSFAAPSLRDSPSHHRGRSSAPWRPNSPAALSSCSSIHVCPGLKNLAVNIRRLGDVLGPLLGRAAVHRRRGSTNSSRHFDTARCKRSTHRRFLAEGGDGRGARLRFALHGRGRS